MWVHSFSHPGLPQPSPSTSGGQMEIWQGQMQLSVNAGDELAPLSVSKDTPRGKRAGGSGRALHIPPLP